MIAGTLTRNADGETYTLSVATLLFDIARLSAVPNAYKTADNHPRSLLGGPHPTGAPDAGGLHVDGREQDVRPGVLLALPSPTAWAGRGG